MSTMKVVGAKLSDDTTSCKFIYEKGDKMYIRTGEDDFIKGLPLQTTLDGACYKWGFYKVENPPVFRDGQELMDSVDNFALTNKRTVTFNESPLK
jgi:hypothetical protein